MSRKMLVNMKEITVSIRGQELVKKLSVSIQRGQLLAIVGANGSGKSTILKLIHSTVLGDSSWPRDSDFTVQGNTAFEPGISLVHLPQLLQTEAGLSLRVDSIPPEKAGLEARLCREFDVKVGCIPDTAVLSDGELQKRAIIKALLEDCDLYLFDEPTNYLDIAGITAFETHVSQLKGRGRGVILVTHDRTLTDNLADQTVLITREAVYRTDGGATDAWSIRRSDVESRRKKAKNIKRKIDQLQQDARAKAGWSALKEKQKIGAKNEKGHISRLSAKMAKRSKVVEKRAEKEIEKLKQTRPYVPKELSLHFPKYGVRNRQVFALKNVWFRYVDKGKRYLLWNVILSASTRDKICLMGANGSGKSTIVKLAMGLLAPTRGLCYRNDGVGTAFVPQGLSGFFHHDRLLDNFDDCRCDQTTVRKHLGAVRIRKDKACDPIDSFSYGELMRAAIVKCILMRAEFLFLDEPTSHLDIESIEVLEQLLQGFPGGFLLISHDRSFVANVAEKLYALDSSRLVLV